MLRTNPLYGGTVLRSLLPILLAILIATVVRQTVAQSTGATLEARRAELKRLLNDEWEYTLRTEPELATNVGDERYNDRLSDFSDKAIAEDLEHSRQALKQFESIDVTGFPEQEKLNHALMVRTLRESMESARFKHWEMPATQFGGIHLEYASLSSYIPFRNVKDYENYLARLHQIPRVLDEAVGHMRDGLRDMLMPPKYLLEKVAAQAQQVAERLSTRVRSPRRCRSSPIRFQPRIALACRRASKKPSRTRSHRLMSDSPSLFARTTLRTAALIPESGLCPTETHAIASPSAIRRQPISRQTRFTRWA